MIRIALAITTAFIVTACSRSVDGVIEYSTGGPIIKANATEIQIVPFDEFKKYVEISRPLLDEKISSFEKQIEREKSFIAELTKRQNGVLNAMIASFGIMFNMNSLGGQYMHQQREKSMAAAGGELEKSSAIVYESKSRISDLHDQIKYLKEGKHGPLIFPAKKINGAILIKTNSNGEFKFELKDDRKYIVLAQRLDLYWFIPVKSKDKFIKLDNNNAVRRVCEICAPGATWPE